jgi:tetratricopeptide (TPR) repeat protein
MSNQDNPSQSLERTPTTADDERGLIEIFQRNPLLTRVAGALAILLATLVAYVPGIRGQFVWDDDYYVTNNRLLRSLDGLQRIWFDIVPSPAKYPLPQYYPMTHTSFWIEYHLWGLNSTGYHVTNVLLHVAGALLIWLILRKLDVPGAWAAAAIFALHPINVESVAWIAERKNVLSAFFFFASLYVYLRYSGVIAKPQAAGAPDASESTQYFTLPDDPFRLYALSLLLFFLALASKTVTSSLPVIVLLIVWWKRGKISLKDHILPLMPFFVLGIAAGALTGWMEVNRVGAHGTDWDYGFATRCIIAGRAAWFYVGKLAFPYPLIFNYPRWNIRATGPLQWMFPLSMIAVVVVLLLNRKRLGRGPVVAVLYYLVTLFPAMGFINVFPMRYSFVADHFVYLSSIGLIALACAGVTRFVIDQVGRERATGALSAACAVVLVFAFALTNSRAGAFENSRVLWEDTLNKTNQQSWLAANNYGEGLLFSGDPQNIDTAEKWFHKVLRLKEDHPEARYNLGLIAERRNQPDEAMKWYHESLHYRPGYILPLFRLGYLHAQRGELVEAERMYQAILSENPDDLNTRLALGRLYERQNRDDDAIKQYEAASEANPDSAQPFIDIGNIKARTGQGELAIQYWSQAARREPNNATIANNVGVVFASGGYFREAQPFFQRAIELNPKFVEAHRQLGIVLARLGRPEEARREFETALKLDPDSEPAKANLAALNEGRLKPATTQSTTTRASER